MTVQADFQLNDDSRRVLRSLKGKRWRLATGEPLAEKSRHYFAWNDVIIATDSGEARIHTKLVERDFEGYEEEYAQLSVHSDSQGLPEAQRNGHIYFQHAGEVITEVYLIRITITQVMHVQYRLRRRVRTLRRCCGRMQDKSPLGGARCLLCRLG